MSKSTPLHVEDIAKLVGALEAYVKETNVSYLDLSYLPLSLETIQSIFQFLPDSRVTELILDGIDISKGMKSLREHVKATKIKRLSIKYCNLYCSELLDLLEILNDTEIVELNTYNYDEVNHDATAEGKLATYLLQSRLIKLSLNSCHLGRNGMFSFAEGLPNSRLSSLYINGCKYPGILTSLFSSLPRSQITDLSINGTELDDSIVRALSVNLAASKIEKLSLVDNKITDSGLDILAQGLINSNVSSLNLRRNIIEGLNDFSRCLKSSKIKILDLSLNGIKSWRMFRPNFLKGSNVESLDLSSCRISDRLAAELITTLKSTKLKKLNLYENKLGRRSITEFVKLLKDTNLEDVNLILNRLPSDRFDLLGGSVKESMLKSIGLDGPKLNETTSCLHFLEGIKSSRIYSVKMPRCQFRENDVKLFAQALINSTFTHLNLYRSDLKDIFSALVENLKHTSVTHLNLSHCSIEDKHAQLLAENLHESKILRLGLSSNDITNKGAEALAEFCPHSSLIHLNLDSNKIGKAGLEILAANFADSLITTLNAKHQDIFPEHRVPIIEKVILGNRVRSHKIVAFFNRISRPSSDYFCFDLCLNDVDVQEFLEECLDFSKSIMLLPQPAVISALLEGASSPISREELASLVYNKFPCQLVEFIGTRVEADTSQLVQLLKRAEELGLAKIVQDLLLLRPSFMIDEQESIMDPYVYSLLAKYKLPICNEAIEPNGIERIKGYFSTHSDLEGAEHVVNLLSNLSIK